MQIWVIPDENGLEPGYQQIYRPASESPNAFRLLASPDGQDGSVQIAQDMSISGLSLTEAGEATYEIGRDRAVWIQMISGALRRMAFKPRPAMA